MKKMFGSNKHVNYGIALALFGILVFSLATSVEGFGLKEGITAPAKDKATAGETPAKLPAKKATTDTKKTIEKALLKLQQQSKP